MEKITFVGHEINKVSFSTLFFGKTMLLGYAFLALAFIGIYEVFDIRYFSAAANAHASGIDPTNPALKEAMRLAVFGDVGEVNRNIPCTLFIAKYM